MLKNKFGMLKVVALALTVLMLATLVACGDKGMDDAAIQDAINNAVQSQADAAAAEQSKLASSLLAEQEKANAEAAAAQESLKAAQAEAEKAAKEAADKAAAAEKAAADAKAKAESEAKAAKEAADKAAASASKAAADAAAAAASASKAQAALESSLAQSSKDALTATTAPNVEEPALKQLQAEFIVLKNKYLTTDYSLYLEAGQKELTNLFTLAEIELMYAKTEAQAKDIMAQLDTDVKAIKNIMDRANEVADLVDALGDIETEVFTTAVEKIVDANDALELLNKDYKGNENLDDALKLINTADLIKANKKLATLEAYIQTALVEDMTILAKADNGKLSYDAEDDRNIVINVNNGEDETYWDVIDRAYYMYRVLLAVNDGNVEQVKAPIDWAYELTKEGEKVKAPADYTHPITGKELSYKLDKEEPTKFFTAEELIENYIRPTLNADFADFLFKKNTGVVDQFEAAMAQLAKAFPATTIKNLDGESVSVVLEDGDIDDILDDAFDAFEASLIDVTFVGTYKANKVYNDAKKDVYAQFVNAYVKAAMAVIEASQAYAKEVYAEEVYDVNVENYNNNDEYEGKPAILANYLAKEEQAMEKFEKNVDSVTIYADYAAITAKAVREANKVEGAVADASKFYSANGVDATFYTYIKTVIENSFVKFDTTVPGEQDGTLGLIVDKMVADLEAFRTEWTKVGGATHDKLAGKTTNTSSTLPWGETVGEDGITWNETNKSLLAALDKEIADTIAALRAIDPAKYEEKHPNVVWNKDTAGKMTKNKAMYFVSSDAKKHFEDMGYTEADILNGTAAAKTYFTATVNESLALTYTYTVEEQACVDAQAAYTAIWKTIYTKLIALKGYEATYTDKIDNEKNEDDASKHTVFEKAQAAVKDVTKLYDEVTAFGADYESLISAALKADQYTTAFNGKSLYVFAANSNNITSGDHTVLKLDATEEQYISSSYSLTPVETKIQGYVDACNNTVGKLADLYAYKVAAAQKVADAFAAAVYTLDAENKLVGNPIYAYANASSTAAKDYEAALATLAEAAQKEIMAVTMKNGKTAEVKDWTGAKELAKDLSLLDYANAIANVDAIVNKYIGTAGTQAKLNGDATVYDYADSAIFQKYKTIIKLNYSDWATIKY